MADKQRKWGQYFTSPEVVDLVLGFCLRQPGDRVLDPSCGEGAFLTRAALYRRWLESAGRKEVGELLWGVEIDGEAAEVTRQALADSGAGHRILTRDFFALRPGGEEDEPLPVFDCVVGNPPYTRAEWLAQAGDEPGGRTSLIRQTTWDDEGKSLARLSKRAGLHAYFIIHGSKFLRPGGRFGFVVSNSWLDVDYGVALKRFLLDHFRIVAIIESDAEGWFAEARVNTCLLILERCVDAAARSQNRVRFARLRRPLSDLLGEERESAGRAAAVEGLIMRLLPGRSRPEGEVVVRVMAQRDLDPTEKWGLYLRAPEVYLNLKSRMDMVRLGDLARVWRGQTTGANEFFYVSQERAAEWQIESEYLRPLLKSPKKLESLTIGVGELPLQVLTVSQPRSTLAGTGALRYIEWGEEQGFQRRSTCARRPRWYALAPQPQEAERLVWLKGIWNRHFCPLVPGEVVIDQQLYAVDPVEAPLAVVAALVNSSWAAAQSELKGRSNFGKGVLWLARYEIESMLLPDPRKMAPAVREELARAWQALAGAPLAPIAEQVTEPARQALDELVFDLLGLAPEERRALVEATVDLAAIRTNRAQGG